MLASHPAIAQLHTIDRDWKRQGLRTQLAGEARLCRALRARRYDLLVHLTEHPRGVTLAHLLRPRFAVTRERAARRMAVARALHAFLPRCRSGRRATPSKRTSTRCGASASIRRRRTSGWCSFPARRRTRASTRCCASTASRRAASSRCIRARAGCSSAGRADRSAALFDAHRRRRAALVDHRRAGRARARARRRDPRRGRSGDPRADRRPDRRSCRCRELAALTARARAFVGVDSAPMHIAAAMGTPTLALFGPSGEIEWGPWRVPHRVVVSRAHPCRPCGIDGCGGGKVSECLTTLGVDDVYARFRGAARRSARRATARRADAARGHPPALHAVRRRRALRRGRAAALLERDVAITLVHARVAGGRDCSCIEPLIVDPFHVGGLWRDCGLRARRVPRASARARSTSCSRTSASPAATSFAPATACTRCGSTSACATRRRSQRLALRVEPVSPLRAGDRAQAVREPAAAAVICNSQMVRDEIRERFGLPDERLHVIHNAVDAARSARACAPHRARRARALGIRRRSRSSTCSSARASSARAWRRAIEALAQARRRRRTSSSSASDKHPARYAALARALGVARARDVRRAADRSAAATTAPPTRSCCRRSTIPAQCRARGDGVRAAGDHQHALGAAELVRAHDAGLVCALARRRRARRAHARAARRDRAQRMGGNARDAVLPLTPEAMTRGWSRSTRRCSTRGDAATLTQRCAAQPQAAAMP